jgi:hypothetical protein
MVRATSRPFSEEAVSRLRKGRTRCWSRRANTPTLDELLEKVSQMAFDLAPENPYDVEPESIFIEVTALREAMPTVA